ncbi:MAG: PDZ domain-containing protein [Planctomycetes bacterium]|nr:PDZ domain-containing protein [Planctomycetota bacterium]
MYCLPSPSVAITAVVAALLLTPLPAEDAEPVPFPNMAPEVGNILEHDYYDQSRVAPVVMAERALRALEAAEIAIDAAWSNDVIRLAINGAASDIPAVKPADLDQAMALIERVRGEIDKAPRLTLKERRDLVYAMLNGALSSLDPHTVLMPPEPASEFDEDIKGEFFGIGAFLNQEDGVITIERVMAGLPAERAGVEDGDIILAINGEKTVGLSLEQAVRRIKGEKGTDVALTLERKAEKEPLTLTITRDRVQHITMRTYRDGDVGYVRMDEFNANAARDLYAAVKALEEKGALSALVLDMRYNGGGLLDQVRIICDFFLGKDRELVRTVTVGGEPQIFKSNPRTLIDAPMVVLVGPGSASAAEILAGGLQRNDRALVIGGTTYGKGSVQSIKNLRDGSRLKLTIQEYQLPGGVSIQDVGVTPDVRLVRHTLRKDGTVDLLPYSNAREADEEFHLKANNSYLHTSTYELGWLMRSLSKEESRLSAISSRDFRPDQEASLVLDLVKAAVAAPGVPDALVAANQQNRVRQALIDAIKDPLAVRGEREASALSEALAKRTSPVIWGGDAQPAPKKVTVAYAGPEQIAPGSVARLAFTVTNGETAAIGRLYGVVKSDKGSPLWEDEVVFGEVAAGGSSSGAIDFKVPPRLHGGEERFTLEVFRDGQREQLGSVDVTLTIAPQPRPHLSYTWELVEPGGNQAIDAGEDCDVRVILKNDGASASAPLTLFVYKDNDPWVQLGGGRYKLDAIPAAGSITVAVPIKVLPELTRAGKQVAYSGSSFALQLNAEERFEDEIDGRYRANLFHKLTLPVGKPVSGGSIVQPNLELLALERTAAKVSLSVRLKDDNPHWIALFHDDDKVDLQDATALAGGVYQVSVTLKPGLNSLRVVATDQDDVNELLPLRMWGPDAPPTPVAQQQNRKPGEGDAVVP